MATNNYEYKHFSSILPRSSTNFFYIPVLRHSKKLSSDILHYPNHIAVFTRPLSPPYLLKSDIVDFINLANQVTSSHRGLVFLIKNHPKDKHKYVYNLLRNGLSNCRVYESHSDPVFLAKSSRISITFYSNLSIDFAYFKIPHYEFYCKSLEYIKADSGIFKDTSNEFSLDYRHFGLSPTLRYSTQLVNCINDLDYQKQLVETSYCAYQNLFNVDSMEGPIFPGLDIC